MACLFYGGLEAGSALSSQGRMDYAEPDAPPHYGPNRSVAIQHIDLWLRIDPENQCFWGRATVDFEPLPDFSGQVELDLDDVEVSSVQTVEGETLGWRSVGDVLEIDAPETLRSVVIHWTGRASGRGLYFTGPEVWAPKRQTMAWTQCQDEDGHFVFPCHDHPRHKHAWSIELEAPVGYTLLSNGEQLEQGVRDGWAWSTFSQKQPMPAYLFTAVAAKLTCLEATWRDRAVRYFVPEGEEEAVWRAMGKTPVMIEHFSQLLGVDYPWPRYDQVVVHDFVFGGMENTACTTMTDVLLVPEAAIDHWDPDSLVAHELAHQWFGDLVTCQDWSQGWLNESWATFLETEWWAFDREKSEATWYRYAQARRYFTEEAGRYRRPIVSYRFKEPIDVFDRHLYEKGSCVLSTLKFELGETAFWSGVSHYLTRHEHDTVHTRHFQRALEAKSGRNLDGFFDQWVHSPGHPALTVSLSHKNGLLLVGLTQTQKAEGVPEAYHFQLTLEILTDQGGPQRVVLPVDSRTRTFALPVDGSIRTVRVDPDFRVLAAISIKAKASWLKVSLHDDCPVVSDRSGSALLKMDGAKPFQAVGIALKTHASGRVRASLAARLSKRGGEEVRALLIEALASETDSVVLQAIATGLGVFQTEDVVTALSEKLAEGGLSQPLTGQLLHALGRTRDLSAVDVLKEYLDTPSWANVIQSGALAGLGATRNAAVFETLVDYTLSRHPARVRGAAASALARLGDEVEALRSEVGEVLMALAQGSGFRDVLSAISGLARLRDHRALGFLSQLHVHARDGRVRRSAYEASVLIQRGHKTAEGLETLRGRVDSLAKQNDALRARLDRVELTEH